LHLRSKTFGVLDLRPSGTHASLRSDRALVGVHGGSMDEGNMGTWVDGNMGWGQGVDGSKESMAQYGPWPVQATASGRAAWCREREPRPFTAV